MTEKKATRKQTRAEELADMIQDGRGSTLELLQYLRSIGLKSEQYCLDLIVDARAIARKRLSQVQREDLTVEILHRYNEVYIRSKNDSNWTGCLGALNGIRAMLAIDVQQRNGRPG